MKAFLIRITGIVQSVGFRPSMYKAFRNYTGWVKNTSDGVLIFLEANLKKTDVESLIFKHKPPNATIESLTITEFSTRKQCYDRFFIKKSTDTHGEILIPPDLGVCDECIKEMFDRNNRRYLHPFINCTNCGPRFSIITGTPYDRDKTTMKHFRMCDRCAEEYNDPANRRFHAQPIACNSCGPEYFLMENRKLKARGMDAIKTAAEKLREGEVILTKGIGGYHLLCDAFSGPATEKVKTIKNRYKKPFAVISKDIETLKKYCLMNREEEKLLLSQSKPIVLLTLKDRRHLKNICMGSPYLGAMLPYAPIHLLLFHFSQLELIVATSANFTEKPLIYKDSEAITFTEVKYVLTNNRKIVRPVEDSIVKVVNHRTVIYRYARGFSPGILAKETKPNILAVGADLKNNIAMTLDNRVVLSQFTGDLTEYDNYLQFEAKLKDLMKFLNFTPEIVVCDKHPDYLSTSYAEENFKRVTKVQHHIAHFASVLFEHGITGGAIGVIMDGTGYGDDRFVWGGEFFIRDTQGIHRIGHLTYMPFAFSDRAVKEPYRLAILWLKYLGIKNHPLFKLYPTVSNIAHSVKTTKTSSAGRLFDVASALLNITHTSSYEAEAAVNLNYRAFASDSDGVFDYSVRDFNIDFRPTVEALSQLYNDKHKSDNAKKFHNTFIEAISENTINISRGTGIKTVALSGGVFQNEIVLSRIIERLSSRGLNVYFNHRIPINDGGIALGQVWFANNLPEQCRNTNIP